MKWSNRSSRRRFLQGGIGAGLATLTGGQPLPDVRRVDAEEYVSGRVEYLDGTGVAQAEVRVLAPPQEDDTTPTILDETTADDEGAYRFEELPLDARDEIDDEYRTSPLLLAAEPAATDAVTTATDRHRRWFRSEMDPFDQDGEAIRLNRELLFGPSLAVTDDEQATGSVCIWRAVSEADRTDQWLTGELVYTRASEPYTEPNPAFAPRRGMFSFTVPDDIYIEYDQQVQLFIDNERGMSSATGEAARV